MEFEWDDAKNASNAAKHGITFEEAAVIFSGPTYSELDDRSHEEDRFVTFGMLPNTLVLVVVHTQRSERIRMISARRATPRERKKFFENLHQS